MNKTLASLILAGTALLPSCTTTTNITPLANEKAVYGSKISPITSRTAPYVIPTINHSGYVLQPQVSERHLSGELNLTFTPYLKPNIDSKESFVVKDRTEGSWNLETETLFVARPYLIGEGDARRLATEAELELEGKWGKKAKVSKIKVKDGLGIRNYTHEDLETDGLIIGLDTDNDPKTPLEQFYAPRVVIAEETKERLLIPVSKSEELTGTESGRIIIRTKELGNIYHLHEMSVKDYNKRPLNRALPNPNPVETPSVIVR